MARGFDPTLVRKFDRSKGSFKLHEVKQTERSQAGLKGCRTEQPTQPSQGGKPLSILDIPDRDQIETRSKPAQLLGYRTVNQGGLRLGQLSGRPAAMKHETPNPARFRPAESKSSETETNLEDLLYRLANNRK